MKNFRLLFKKTLNLAFGNAFLKLTNDYPDIVSHIDLIQNNKDLFTQYVHDGYKEVQNILIREISLEQKQIKRRSKLLKKFRQRRNKSSERFYESLLQDNTYRISLWRSIADIIAWSMVGGESAYLKRFSMGIESEKHLEDSNLSSLLPMVNDINQDPMKFALISDLTNIIQVGDILVRDPLRNRLSIVECKEGDVNSAITNLLDKPPSEEKFKEFAEKYGKKGMDQFLRVLNQKERSLQLLENINYHKGVHPRFKVESKIVEPKRDLFRFYSEELEALEENCSLNSFGFINIEDILHYVSYYSVKQNSVDICYSHKLLRDLGKQKFKIYDYRSIETGNTYSPILSKPFSENFILRYLLGDIKISVFIDFDQLIKMFNEKGLISKWLSQKDTARLIQKKPSLKSSCIVEGQMISIVINNKDEIYFSNGLLMKIILESIRPTSIVDLLKVI